MQDNPVPKILMFIGGVVITILGVVWGYSQYNSAANGAGNTVSNAVTTVSNSGSYGTSANPTVTGGSVTS